MKKLMMVLVTLFSANSFAVPHSDLLIAVNHSDLGIKCVPIDAANQQCMISIELTYLADADFQIKVETAPQRYCFFGNDTAIHYSKLQSNIPTTDLGTIKLANAETVSWGKGTAKRQTLVYSVIAPRKSNFFEITVLGNYLGLTDNLKSTNGFYDGLFEKDTDKQCD